VDRPPLYATGVDLESRDTTAQCTSQAVELGAPRDVLKADAVEDRSQDTFGTVQFGDRPCLRAVLFVSDGILGGTRPAEVVAGRSAGGAAPCAAPARAAVPRELPQAGVSSWAQQSALCSAAGCPGGPRWMGRLGRHQSRYIGS